MNLPAVPSSSSPAILAVALERLAPASRRAYLADLRGFAGWSGHATPAAALAAFLELEHGPAHDAAQAWAGAMLEELSPRTVARRLATLRSVVRSAKRGGHVAWNLDVKGPTIDGYVRDTRGPPAGDVATVIAELEGQAQAGGGQMAMRDLSIVLLLHDSALRRGEVCSLEVRHVDLARGYVQIAGKGKAGARQWWPVSPRCKRALARWLRARGKQPGPLFCSVGIGRDSRGITPKTVYRRVIWWATQCGFEGWRPHGLRHAAITALQRETGDLDRSQRFARHKSPATTGDYLDTEPEAVKADAALVARVSAGPRRTRRKRGR